MPHPAHASTENEDRARGAYDAAARAYDANDFETAAADFALADELVPNATVLKLALAAAIRAQRAELAMNLVLRAEERGVSEQMADLVQLSREQFASQVGFFRVSCAPNHACSASVDGRPIAPGATVARAPGTLNVTFGTGAAARSSSARVRAAQIVEVREPEAPLLLTSKPSSTPAEAIVRPISTELPSKGLPQAVFWSGAAVSVALGVATLASSIDAANARQDFLAHRSEETRDHGQAAVARSNVLLGAAVGSALVTAAIGLLFTHWHQPSAGRARWRAEPRQVLSF